MSHMRLWASAAIIALVILVSFAFSVPRVRDVVVEKAPVIEQIIVVPAVSLSDSFKKGMHTISGSLEVPNACTPVSAEATIIGNASSTDGILVAISTQTDSGVCLQMPTKANFQTTISAPANLPIKITVNGFEATTTAP